MSGGGKGGGDAVVGFKYLMGVQLAVCHGPVDSLNRIVIGEREAWAGTQSSNGTISINKPELFGGDSREGGVVGDVDVLFGGSAQARNTYLATHQEAENPAYRGLLSVVFKSFQWSSGNPYFKAPWIEVTRILAGWQGGTAWNAADAIINGKDMNPAHIIYQCLTSSAWGMGYTSADIDNTSFTACAATLKAEGFGLSLEWDTQSTIEAFVKTILDHINGSLGLDLTTGKFVLKLIRFDYDPNVLLELNESNVIEMRSFQRAAFGDAPNEIVVTYVDRDGRQTPVAVQDLASIAAQGGVISRTNAYPGIREPELAARVAMRDLATLSAPLAQMTVVTNRVTWDKEHGDVLKVNWPSLGLGGVIFRIIDIDKGTLTDSKITITMVEDIFGLPASSYTVAPSSQWVDTVVPPVSAEAAFAVEVPYWDVVRTMRLADQAQLQPGYGFGMVVASRGAVQSLGSYVVSASSDNVTYTDVATGHFVPNGVLSASITSTQTNLVLTGAFDLDSVVLSADGGYAYIGSNECVSVLSVNANTGEVTVGRGILDTVPVYHYAGVKVFFVTPGVGYDPTERVAGETVLYKPRPNSALGTLALESATARSLTLNNRASRPYPPGNVKLNGLSYPGPIAGPTVTLTWSHRDRTAQTVDFVDHTVGNIGPEPGVTYRVRVWANLYTMIRYYDLSGDTTSWTYPNADSVADGNLRYFIVRVHSVRDGIESLYGAEVAVIRSSATGGGTSVETKPATPVLSVIEQQFSLALSWVLGDGRTNITKAEIRVSDSPDFNTSTVLQYVDYPTLGYTHEVGTARTYKWYWVRMLDTSGMMSEWSNMVSGRTLSIDPSTILSDINTLLSSPDTPDTLELLSNRFSVVAPDGTKTPFAVVESPPGSGLYQILLNGNVLIGGNVDIANLNSGALPNDVVMSLGGGVIELDGAGEIRVHRDLQANADFVRLTAGEIRFLTYRNGAYRTYNYLSRIESGIADSGATVAIPGYWRAQPRVMVSPAVLTTYKAAYAAQDQNLSCSAASLVETSPGSGQWQFTATATLSLAANTGSAAIGATSGSTSSNTYTGATQTAPANCVQITPTVSLQSERGDGAGQWYYRSAKWRVEYWDGAAWVLGSWRTVAMGAQRNAVTDSVVFDFPSAASWQWRIGFEALDTDSTLFGIAEYDYSTETLTGTGGIVAQAKAYGDTSPSVTVTASKGSLPTSAVNPTWEIYQIDYSFQYDLTFSTNVVSAQYLDMGSGDTNIVCRGTQKAIAYKNAYNNIVNVLNASATHTVSGSSLTRDLNPISATAHAYAGYYGGYSYSFWATTNLDTLTEKIYRRNPKTTVNSTTAANVYTLSSYTYNLTSAQTLASGTLNWQATGE